MWREGREAGVGRKGTTSLNATGTLDTETCSRRGSADGTDAAGLRAWNTGIWGSPSLVARCTGTHKACAKAGCAVEPWVRETLQSYVVAHRIDRLRQPSRPSAPPLHSPSRHARGLYAEPHAIGALDGEVADQLGLRLARGGRESQAAEQCCGRERHLRSVQRCKPPISWRAPGSKLQALKALSSKLQGGRAGSRPNDKGRGPRAPLHCTRCAARARRPSVASSGCDAGRAALPNTPDLQHCVVAADAAARARAKGRKGVRHLGTQLLRVRTGTAPDGSPKAQPPHCTPAQYSYSLPSRSPSLRAHLSALARQPAARRPAVGLRPDGLVALQRPYVGHDEQAPRHAVGAQQRVLREREAEGGGGTGRAQGSWLQVRAPAVITRTATCAGARGSCAAVVTRSDSSSRLSGRTSLRGHHLHPFIPGLLLARGWGPAGTAAASRSRTRP